MPPGAGWTADPYGAEVRDGRMFGRGVAVSKSDFATYTFAVLALYGAGPRTLSEANGHRADENLRLDDLYRATEVVALALCDLLTPQP